MRTKFFTKIPIPDDIPDGMEEIISDINRCRSRRSALKRAYDLLSERFHGGRCETYLKLPLMLISDVHRLWDMKGYMHCTNINYLLRIILVKSRWFDDSDIEVRFSLIWYLSPHQYLRIRTGRQSIDIDIWAKRYGIGFGDYAIGFR